MPMVRRVRAAMNWHKFILLGIENGDAWDREESRIRKELGEALGGPKLIFVSIPERGEASDDDEEDLCYYR